MTDYNNLGSNPLSDPLHQYAYGALGGVALIKGLIALADNNATFARDKLLTYIYSEFGKQFMLITLHFYVVQNMKKERERQTRYEDPNRFNNSLDRYKVGKGIDLAILVLIYPYFLSNTLLNIPRLYDVFRNSRSSTEKGFNAFGILGDLSVAGLLATSDYYIVTGANRPVDTPRAR
jgi:hypothetical protein